MHPMATGGVVILVTKTLAVQDMQCSCHLPIESLCTTALLCNSNSCLCWTAALRWLCIRAIHLSLCVGASLDPLE